MAIRTVAVSEAPQRQRGSRLTINQDVNDVLDAIKNPANKGKAIIVTMSDPSWTAVKDGKPIYVKPETAFAYYLRRRFAADKLGIVAYQSARMEVTVRAMTAAEIHDAQHPQTRAKRK